MKYILILLTIANLYAKSLLFYCGITMSKAMSEIAKNFEKQYNVSIEIIPGGSKSLLKTIKNSKKGDLYLPGSESYILKNKNLFIDYKYIGYNKLALIVKKGNPKNIHSINDLTKSGIRTVLCNYKLSSCGKETKKVIKPESLYWKVYDGAVEIVLDSSPLNDLVSTYADVGPNWQATIKNSIYNLEAIPIKKAKKHNLYLAVLKYSNNKDLALKFLNYAANCDKILKKHGFRDETKK